MRSTWLAERAPTFFAVIAEGAWLSVLYVAVQAVARSTDQPLGVVLISLTVGIGLLVARWTEGRRLRSAILAAALAVAGVVGVLASATARAQLGDGPGAVFAAHAGGVILMLALIRGYAHRDTSDAEHVIDRLLRWGALWLVIPWAIGLSLTGPERDEFIAGAFGGTVIFVAAALIALSGSRLRTLGDQAGFDWRAGRAWLGTMTVVVVALALFMVPSAFILGAPVSVAVREILAPIAILLWSIPLGAGSIVAVLLSPVLAFLGPLINRLLTSISVVISDTAEPGGQVAPETTASATDWVVGVVVIILAIVAAVIIRRIARRPGRGHLELDEPTDRRRMVIPISAPRIPLPHLRLPGFQRNPRDAVGAYLRLLSELARDPDLARAPTETPHDHALRLRTADRTGLALDLLAADYELARFAGAELTQTEERRAVDRWRRLRHSVRAASERVRSSGRG